MNHDEQYLADLKAGKTDPMVPLMAGWLLGAVATKAGDCLKIVDYYADPPGGFVVKFASGLNLRVEVSLLPSFTKGGAMSQ